MKDRIFLVATTVGPGPFRPAIKLNGLLWTIDREYPTEDGAAEVAIGTVANLDTPLKWAVIRPH